MLRIWNPAKKEQPEKNKLLRRKRKKKITWRHFRKTLWLPDPHRERGQAALRPLPGYSGEGQNFLPFRLYRPSMYPGSGRGPQCGLRFPDRFP